LKGNAEIYLAGGCFWGMEKYLQSLRGVMSTEVGYANGNKLNPTYEEVCRHNTGHAETVRVEYDPQVIPLRFLLDIYFQAIDPTSVNRQGPDIGTQYRTGIYYVNDADRPVIDKSISELAKKYAEPIAIEVKPLENFSRAEEYHQKYLDKNPGGYCHIGEHLIEMAKQASCNPSSDR
jgi:methionine-S-sulfoxide reductase